MHTFQYRQFNQTEGNHLAQEASTLGFQPGQVPTKEVEVVALGQPFTFVQTEVETNLDGDVTAWKYVLKGWNITLTIFND